MVCVSSNNIQQVNLLRFESQLFILSKIPKKKHYTFFLNCTAETLSEVKAKTANLQVPLDLMQTHHILTSGIQNILLKKHQNDFALLQNPIKTVFINYIIYAICTFKT